MPARSLMTGVTGHMVSVVTCSKQSSSTLIACDIDIYWQNCVHYLTYLLVPKLVLKTSESPCLFSNVYMNSYVVVVVNTSILMYIS